MDAEHTRAADRGVAGITLVELLVVLAILGIMAGLAVPTFVRMGYFSKNDVADSSRELYAKLKNAKVYGATYHVNAALAYQMFADATIDFSQASDSRRPASGFIKAAAIVYQPQGSANFVPVPGESGFLSFQGNTGIPWILGANSIPCDSSGTPLGVLPLTVQFSDVSSDTYQTYGSVFEISGRLSTTATGELFTLTVGAAPDDMDTRTVPIHLYRSTGRVKIGNEEG